MNPVWQAVRDNALLLIMLGALVSAFIFLRSPATPLPSLQALDQELSDGKPKVVEFYSDF